MPCSGHTANFRIKHFTHCSTFFVPHHTSRIPRFCTLPTYQIEMLADKDMNNLPSVVVAGCRTREYERRPLSFHIKPSLDLVSRGVYLAAAAVWPVVTLLLAADESSSCDCDSDSDPVASQLSSSEQRDDDHVPRPSETVAATVAATSCRSRSQSVGGSSLTAS